MPTRVKLNRPAMRCILELIYYPAEGGMLPVLILDPAVGSASHQLFDNLVCKSQ